MRTTYSGAPAKRILYTCMRHGRLPGKGGEERPLALQVTSTSSCVLISRGPCLGVLLDPRVSGGLPISLPLRNLYLPCSASHLRGNQALWPRGLWPQVREEAGRTEQHLLWYLTERTLPIFLRRRIFLSKRFLSWLRQEIKIRLKITWG